MRDFLELTKPRITVLILICTAVGYLFGSTSFHLSILLDVMLGTALMASGTAALNQWYEGDSDAKMRRTCKRPIASGRMKRSSGLAFGVFLSVAGFADLWFGANALAAALGLFTLASYIFVYTPLKRRSAICTTVGALPGALPPLIGYAAASGVLDAKALALFLILFVWQFPHFYAIAWMYREDYARAGFEMISKNDDSGSRSASQSVLFCFLQLFISGVPAFLKVVSSTYLAAELVLNGLFIFVAMRFLRTQQAADARRLFLTSILYLPLLLAALVLTKL